MPHIGNLDRFGKDETFYPTDALTYSSTRDLSNLAMKSLSIWNSGAALTNGVILISPDNAKWGTLLAIQGGTLGSAAIATYAGENAYRYWKLGCTVASGTGTITASWRF
jgi:hypothetical protein